MPSRNRQTKPARPASDYAFEAGVRYRHLRPGEAAAGGESPWEYHCLDHKSGELVVSRVAVKDDGDGRGDVRILTLVNRWNGSAHASGRTYFVTF